VKRTWRRLTTALFARFPSLVDRWLERHPVERSTDVPWTAFEGEVARARVGLVTTAGVHLRDQRPFDMEDSDGDPSWRRLPSDAPEDALAVTHDYYDTRSARRDVNVVYPGARLHELARAGRVGAVAHTHAGLMGHVDGPHLATLVERTAPRVARSFVDQRADIVLLAPA